MPNPTRGPCGANPSRGRRPLGPRCAQVALAMAWSLSVACAADLEEPGDAPADGGSALADLPSRPDAGGPTDASVGADAGATCDPIVGSGCTTGLACFLVAGEPVCAPVGDATGTLGMRCEGGDCAPGLSCLRTTTATAAECRKVCDLESGGGCELLPGEFECRLRLGEGRWGACVQLPTPCNPYSQRPCEPEQACQPFLRRTGERDLRCQTAGLGGAGEPCGMQLGGCQRGLACVADPSGRDARCRRYCELNSDCPRPEQCTGRVDEPSFGFCQP